MIADAKKNVTRACALYCLKYAHIQRLLLTSKSRLKNRREPSTGIKVKNIFDSHSTRALNPDSDIMLADHKMARVVTGLFFLEAGRGVIFGGGAPKPLFNQR